jgi:hypothetical protein
MYLYKVSEIIKRNFVISRSHHVYTFQHRRKFLTNKALFMEITVFLYFTLYGMVDRYQPCGGICYLHP